MEYEEVEPQASFHGTRMNKLMSMRAKGLMPGKRVYAHLSPTPEDGCAVAKRGKGSTVYLIINCLNSVNSGMEYIKPRLKFSP